MKLYEYSVTRSIRCRWLLQELDLPFDSVTVDLTKEANDHPDFLKVNPVGAVPALVDDDLTLFESGAICTYLADKAPEREFIPTFGSKLRPLHDQWMFFCMSELEQPLWMIAKHTFIYPEVERSESAILRAKADFQDIVTVLESHMKDRDFVLGNKFQTVDVMIGQTLIWAFAMRMTKHLDLLERCPSLIAYLRRLSERPKMPNELRSLLLERLKSL